MEDGLLGEAMPRGDVQYVAVDLCSCEREYIAWQSHV